MSESKAFSPEEQEVFARIKPIIVDQLGVTDEQVVADAPFAGAENGGLEADSLDLVELIMSMEEQFGVDISDEEAEKIMTVRAAVEYINERRELWGTGTKGKKEKK